MLKDSQGKELVAEWKANKPNEVEVKLPLQEAQPGVLTLMVTQSGATVSLKRFPSAPFLTPDALRDSPYTLEIRREH